MHNDMSGFIIVWCHHLHNQGGTWVHVPSVVVRVKFFKSSRFGSVTTGYDTLLKFWSAWFTAWVWTACGDMIVQYRVQQNQFLVILVHLRCFVVICLTSFFVFNTVLCFLVCSLSVCLSTEEVSVTVLVFLVLYIFLLIFSVKRPLCILYMSPASPQTPTWALPLLDPAGELPPQTPFCPPSKFLATPVVMLRCFF